MLLAAVNTGHGAGLEVSGGKSIFFDYDSGDIKFFRYRTSHQDSFDHGSNISHRRGKACPILSCGPNRDDRKYASRKTDPPFGFVRPSRHIKHLLFGQNLLDPPQ
jgi:hypothetical protein